MGGVKFRRSFSQFLYQSFRGSPLSHCFVLLASFFGTFFWLCSARLEFPHAHKREAHGCCSSTRAGSGRHGAAKLVVNTRLVVSDDGKVQVRITNPRLQPVCGLFSWLPSMAPHLLWLRRRRRHLRQLRHR